MSKKLLDKINYPSDLRLLKKSQLEQVAKELRTELIDVVSETGGHLGAGLGVVELTVAPPTSSSRCYPSPGRVSSTASPGTGRRASTRDPPHP